MRDEIRIAGFGGQGAITIGVLLARAVGQFKGLEVAQTQSYGPEARGGACKSDVVISDTIIDYIKPMELRNLVAMSQPAFDLYAATLPDDAQLIIDSTLVTTVPDRFTRVTRIPATDIAERELGAKLLANMVMLGQLLKVTQWASMEHGFQAADVQFAAKWHEKNRLAIQRGFDHV